ncbi:hypothetical protein [Cutibacterium acnes]|nr:hypothetical protein [Cutibacterium acnes]
MGTELSQFVGFVNKESAAASEVYKGQAAALRAGPTDAYGVG